MNYAIFGPTYKSHWVDRGWACKSLCRESYNILLVLILMQ